MNIKLQTGSIRYKLQPGEMEELISKKFLQETIIFINETLCFQIRQGPQYQHTQASYSKEGVVLMLPEAEIRKLKEIGQSKEGLIFNRQGLKIQIQVDLGKC